RLLGFHGDGAPWNGWIGDGLILPDIGEILGLVFPPGSPVSMGFVRSIPFIPPGSFRFRREAVLLLQLLEEFIDISTSCLFLDVKGNPEGRVTVVDVLDVFVVI